MNEFNPDRAKRYAEYTPISADERALRRKTTENQAARHRQKLFEGIKRTGLAAGCVAFGIWAVGKVLSPDAASVPLSQDREALVELTNEIKSAPLNVVELEEIVNVSPGERGQFLLNLCAQNPDIQLPEGAPDCESIINSPSISSTIIAP